MGLFYFAIINSEHIEDEQTFILYMLKKYINSLPALMYVYKLNLHAW